MNQGVINQCHIGLLISKEFGSHGVINQCHIGLLISKEFGSPVARNQNVNFIAAVSC